MTLRTFLMMSENETITDLVFDDSFVHNKAIADAFVDGFSFVDLDSEVTGLGSYIKIRVSGSETSKKALPIKQMAVLNKNNKSVLVLIYDQEAVDKGWHVNPRFVEVV